MPVPTVDPKVAIKNLVVANWNAANIVNSITPDFHTGWWNPKSLSTQVTFTGRSESFSGSSGYNAIEGGGGGPVQTANGVLFVNAWAYRDEGAGGPNPKQVVYDMAEEVRRIVLANYNQVADISYVSVLSTDEVEPNPTDNPMVFRIATTVGYQWRTT
jgi:hypothetical protein